MGRRGAIAIVLGGAIFVVTLGSPVPASNSAASSTASASPTATAAQPTLAPIDLALPPEPSASPTAGQPKVIGHVYASAYCTNFVEHFNNAAVVIIGNDQQLDSVGVTLRSIEDDWNKRDGGFRVWNARVSLIAAVGKMQRTIPQEQAEVNALLAQAKATTDPARKAALQESASQLQHSVDRQRSVADDLRNVIDVLLDKHKAEDTAETNINYMLPPGVHEGGISLNDDPVPEPGVNTMMQPSPSPSPSPGYVPTPKPGSVEDVLQWSRQRSIISTAESRAAVAADRIVRICNQEAEASPGP